MPFAVLCLAVAATLLVMLFAEPVTAGIAERWITCDATLAYDGQITAPCVVAICGPLLLSSRKRIVVVGFLTWLKSSFSLS